LRLRYDRSEIRSGHTLSITFDNQCTAGTSN
jgi:hypothetical protein